MILNYRAGRYLVGALFFAAIGLLLATPSYGATVDQVEPVVGVDWFDFATPANVVLMVGIFVPVLTALIVKKVASSEVKSISTLVLSAILATIGTVVGNDGGWAWRDFGNAFLSVFIPAIASYYGFWKHSVVTRVVTEKTENFGVLGKARNLETQTRPDGPDPADDVEFVAHDYGHEPDLGETSARTYEH